MKEKLWLNNFRIFTIVSSFWGIAMGLFGPFYVLYIQDIGGSLENLGIAFGIMVFAQSFVSYFAGKYSDRFGRKPFLIIVGYSNAIVFLFYLLIENLWQLYALQALWGVVDAIDTTTTKAFLADITSKKRRGLEMGKFDAIVGIFAATSMIIGGLIAGKYGLGIIFYICSGFYFLSTTLLFLIKERK